jgi:predicted nucleotide-binding protein
MPRAGQSVSSLRPRVLLVDNEQAHVISYAQAFLDANFDVDVADSPQECMNKLQRRRIEVVVLDLMMPHGDEFSSKDTHTGLKTGLALARWIRREFPTTRLLCLSVYLDSDAASWFARFGGGAFIKNETSPLALVRQAERMLADRGRKPGFQAFIVHGRAHETRDALRTWLKRTGLCPKPIVLQDEPSLGLTIVEKFEQHANDVDVVFVLLTPDDVGHLASSDANSAHFRARQNVLFELGYFYGRLRRSSGRIILLTEGNLELPSDIGGVPWIDMSRGFRYAIPELRKELRGLTPDPVRGDRGDKAT